jgi:Spy/CpxP family protein refolding chaperone
MRTRWLKISCTTVCLAAVLGINAFAQHGGGNPAGPPTGGPVRSGPGGPAGPPSASPGARTREAPEPGVRFGPVGRWWDDKSTVKSIGLSGEQQKRMDTIFNANKPEILARYQDFLKVQSKLEAVSKDPKASQEQTFAVIDAVNQARAALQKAAAQMYLQVRQQLDPEQMEKLEKIQ